MVQLGFVNVAFITSMAFAELAAYAGESMPTTANHIVIMVILLNRIALNPPPVVYRLYRHTAAYFFTQ